MRGFAWVVACSLAGCTMYFTGDGDDDQGGAPETCDRPATVELTYLRNPITLSCDSFDLRGCPAGCECPAVDVPLWPRCESECDGLSESACAANPACRITRDSTAYFGAGNDDSFLGCYPLGLSSPPPDGLLCYQLHFQACSSVKDCVAVYDTRNGTQFETCVPSGLSEPGECTGESCSIVGVDCPDAFVPGVVGGCETGACVPVRYCAPS